MDHFPSVLARQCRAALSAGLILAFSSNAALSAENCQRLEALANQYAGVELTSDQKQLKRKMVSWYSTHCMHRAARCASHRLSNFIQNRSANERTFPDQSGDSAAKHEGKVPCMILNATAIARKSV